MTQLHNGADGDRHASHLVVETAFASKAIQY